MYNQPVYYVQQAKKDCKMTVKLFAVLTCLLNLYSVQGGFDLEDSNCTTLVVVVVKYQSD